MSKVPEKCSRCGSPINWEEGSSSIECSYCGNINYSKKNIFNFKISKNKLIFPIKDFLINKKILNRNQIDYINKKTSKLFEKRLFRLSILLIFISTPIVIYKKNQIDTKLINICLEISKKEGNDFSAKQSYKNCIKKIKLVDKVFPGELILEYFVSKKATHSYYDAVNNYLAKDIKELKEEAKGESRLKNKSKEKSNTETIYDKTSPKYRTYISSGQKKSDLKDYEGAISDFTKAIRLYPEFYEGYASRGIPKYFLEDYEGAISDFTKAIQLNADDYTSYSFLGEIKIDLKDWTGAISDFTKAIRLSPDDNKSLYGLYKGRGKAQMSTRYFEGAISDFNKALNLNPNDSFIYYYRGFSKLALKDYAGALIDTTKAIQLDPYIAEFYLGRGRSKMSLRDFKGGCSDFRNALRLGDKVTKDLAAKFLLLECQ